jgi:4-amino-4-deoxy-L-arabinose transferase-like glycosyltransferase
LQDGDTNWFRSVHYRLVVLTLFGLCLLLLVYPLVRSFSSIDINYNEGWNAYFQDRAMSGQTIYSKLSPLFFCNYPPLSFYIVGTLGKIFGDPIVAGRLVSIAALGCVTLTIAWIVRFSGANRLEALAAATVCLIAFVTFYVDYVGMNDPQLLGMAFSIGALGLCLCGNASAARGALISVLITVSLLIKHNLLVVPIVIVLDMLFKGNRRQLIAYIGTGLLIGAAAAVLIWAREGTAFFEQLFLKRTWSAQRAGFTTAELLMRHQALAVITIFGLIGLRTRLSSIILVYVLLALFVGLYFIGGAGTGPNMFYDLVVSLSIGVGLVLSRLRLADVPPIALATVFMAACTGPLIKAPWMLGVGVKQIAGSLGADSKASNQDIAFLKTQPATAFCESLVLCFRSGEPMNVDLFNSLQAIETGRLSKDALTSRVSRHEFSVIQMRYLTAPNSIYSDASQSLITSIKQNYHVAHRGVSGELWVPNVQGVTQAISSAN